MKCGISISADINVQTDIEDIMKTLSTSLDEILNKYEDEQVCKIRE